MLHCIGFSSVLPLVKDVKHGCELPERLEPLLIELVISAEGVKIPPPNWRQQLNLLHLTMGDEMKSDFARCLVQADNPRTSFAPDWQWI